MTSIIAGGGQVGQALREVLECYKPKIIDLDPKRSLDAFEEKEGCEVLHIAFPWSNGFIEAVKAYQERFKPKVTVIHSSVMEGSSRKLGAVFSPVVGIHPFLVRGLRIFTKYLAGEGASLVADYFRRAGLKIAIMGNSDELEYAKLRQTKFYALQIEFIKDTARDCKRKNFSFGEVYTIPAMDYNRGYAEQGMPEYHLPLLVPILTPQGGNCTMPNLELQPDAWSYFIKKMDAEETERSRAASWTDKKLKNGWKLHAQN